MGAGAGAQADSPAASKTSRCGRHLPSMRMVFSCYLFLGTRADA
jgi:hypothetical protein